MAVKNIILKDADGNYVIPYVGIPSQTGNEGKVLGTNREIYNLWKNRIF